MFLAVHFALVERAEVLLSETEFNELLNYSPSIFKKPNIQGCIGIQNALFWGGKHRTSDNF